MHSAEYTAVRRLAKGGMGEVFIGVRSAGDFRRVVAIKRLLPELAQIADVREMFLREARHTALIHHPNVIPVLDVGEDENGPYLVMPYQAGVTGAAFSASHLRSGQLPPLEVAIQIATDIARGLDGVHSARGPSGALVGLVHRDLSPQNVIVSWDGISYVTDLGVAKATGPGAMSTTTGARKGKVSYMSPEQLRLERLDARSDLFSLGVVLVELVTTRRLYQITDESGVSAILEDPPPDLRDLRSDVPPELVELVYELLAKQRDARPSSAKVVAERLSAIGRSLNEQTTVAAYLQGMGADTMHEQERLISECSSYPITAEEKPGDAPIRIPAKATHPVLIGGAILVALGVLGVTVVAAVAALVSSGLFSETDTPIEPHAIPVTEPNENSAPDRGDLRLPEGFRSSDASPPRVELRFDGCNVDMNGHLTVQQDTLNHEFSVTSVETDMHASSVTLRLGPNPPAEMTLSSEHRHATGVIVNIASHQDIWTNLTLALDGNQIRGSLRINRYDLVAGQLDVVFDNVVLEHYLNHTLCTVNGRVQIHDAGGANSDTPE